MIRHHHSVTVLGYIVLNLLTFTMSTDHGQTCSLRRRLPCSGCCQKCGTTMICPKCDSEPLKTPSKKSRTSAATDSHKSTPADISSTGRSTSIADGKTDFSENRAEELLRNVTEVAKRMHRNEDKICLFWQLRLKDGRYQSRGSWTRGYLGAAIRKIKQFVDETSYRYTVEVGGPIIEVTINKRGYKKPHNFGMSIRYRPDFWYNKSIYFTDSRFFQLKFKKKDDAEVFIRFLNALMTSKNMEFDKNKFVGCEWKNNKLLYPSVYGVGDYKL